MKTVILSNAKAPCICPCRFLFRYREEGTLVGRPVDTFWLELQLNHPDCDPAILTQELPITPWCSARAGQVIGPVTRKTTVWFAHLDEGLSNDEFQNSLLAFVVLLDDHSNFFDRFVSDGGRILLAINQSVGFGDGVLFRLELAPEFLLALGRHGVELQVQAWTDDFEIWASHGKTAPSMVKRKPMKHTEKKRP
jgi:hypothetical protein